MTTAKTFADERRKDRLERAAVAVGHAWVAACSERLHEEGRQMTGGWPGTMSEARARVAAHVRAELRNAPAPTKEEIETLAKLTYGAARDVWLAKAGRDPES